jgi:dual specificity phosphatase 12
MVMAAHRPWTRWPNTPLRLLHPTLPPRLVGTADERSGARCAGQYSSGMRCGLSSFRRRHLAVREHMMDHILDQAPISRPRTPSNFALPSPKISMGDQVSNAGSGHQRRGSAVSDIINPLTGQPGARAKSRQNSFTAGSQFGPLSTMTSSGDDKDGSGDSGMPVSPGIGAGVPMPKPTPQVIMTSASPEVATGFPVKGVPFPVSTLSGQNNQVASSPAEISRSSSVDLGSKIKGRPESGSGSGSGSGRQILSADQLSSRLPPQLLALRQAGSGAGISSPIGSSPASSPEQSPSQNQNQGQAQGQGQGVQSAARRMSMLAMTSTDANGNSLARERKGSNASDVSAFGSLPNAGPTILVNPKCSGYFVEPVSLLDLIRWYFG